MKKKIYYIDRQTGEKKQERVYYEKTLHFLYGSALGRFFTNIIAHIPFFSQLFGWWQSTRWTRHKIAPFIQKYGVKTEEFAEPATSFTSFNAFFVRKLKKQARPISSGAILPADGRYLVYPNCETVDGFVIKGKKFSLKKLIGNADLANKYAKGALVIARLCPSDYHRFHFPLTCTPSAPRLINGPLYSVNPIALQQNLEIFSENKRVITSLETERHGKVLFIEVGATNVGSIHQTYIPNQTYQKGDEKGFFSFGGSSILLLFETSAIQFADDLIKNSAQHIETLCLFGQSLEN
ncbi:MAG: Phosphatidylserine decarboxylase proenzyme [Chlamydiales bacterium]|nr:Phosphatidylserine decarboxylase proenzyme [Chlamydiales bacterium]